MKSSRLLISTLIMLIHFGNNILAQSPALVVEGNGVHFPRFSSQERDSLLSPSDGLLIYNTDTKCIEQYRGSLWYSLCDGGQIVTRGINLLLGSHKDEQMSRFGNIRLTSDGGYILAAQTNSPAGGDISSRSHGLDDIWIVKLSGYGVIIWDKLIGGDRSENGPIIHETNDGGFIVLSSSSSSANGDVTESTHGSSDLWIAKLDVLGNIIWNRLIGGNTQELAYDIKQTADGGYIILASSSSSTNGDVTDVNNGFSDYWVVKLDDLGNVVWNKLYGGNGNEFPGGIQQTFDGGYVVSGSSTSSQNGDVSDVNHGEDDFWVLKLDSIGNKIWDRLLGGNKNERATDILQTDDGGYIILGNSTSSTSGDVMGVNNNVFGNPDGNDWWVVRVDSLGNILWGKLLGGNSYDSATEIRQTPDGGFIIIGDSGSSQSGDVAQVNNGLRDGWIVKIDGLGNLIWERLLGADDQDFLHSFCQNSDGSLVLAGWTKSSANGDITSTNHGGSDIWIIKVDSSGNIIMDGVNVANFGLSGVYGYSNTQTGVEGYSETGIGVYGFSESGVGGRFSSLEVDGSAKVGMPGAGSTLLTLNSERSWVFRQLGTGAGTALELAVANANNANKNFVISTTANVGIGITNPVHPLHMASQAHVTAGGVWTNSSSKALKENIYDLTVEEAISTIEALNPVKFNYLLQKDEEYVGFIAEDVPDLVATQDRKSLSPMDIVAVLTKVVQDQEQRINLLEKQVTELKTLSKEMSELKHYLKK